jgi:L-aminopeptidase/D-esterase-like protein
MNSTLTAVPNVRVGHFTDLDAATGCTVVLCPAGTVGGVDQRGGAPGTRETDLLRPLHLVEHVNAFLLSGGSAYGLAAADGVMRFLEERRIGYRIGDGVVPIVPAAIVMDLWIGSFHKRPGAEEGYEACIRANEEPVEQGNVGAGTGCVVGSVAGINRATKGGLGSAAVALDNGLVVGALVAVNALGEILDEHGQILAGVRFGQEGREYVSALEELFQRSGAAPAGLAASGHGGEGTATIVGVVATNGRLNKERTNLIAQMAQDGIARAVRPSHTLYDGDTLFALATGEVGADTNVVGAYAADLVAQSIRNAVRAARPLGGIPSCAL